MNSATPLSLTTLCSNFTSFRLSNSPIIRSDHRSFVLIDGNSNFFLNQLTHSSSLYPASFAVLKFTDNIRSNFVSTRGLSSVTRSYKSDHESGGNLQRKGNELACPILRRWDVPWPWQTVALTLLACGISFELTGWIDLQLLPYLGIHIGNLTLEERTELLFVDQGIATAAVLGVLFNLTESFQPLPDDLYRYDLREPFNLQKGWLLWAGIGLAGALGAIALTGVALSSVSGENPQRESDALVRLLPLISSSRVSTIFLVGATGVLAPLLEETVFRGFFMTSLTKWIPTPVAVVVTAAVFAVAHLTLAGFPQLFVLGIATGLTYAQTRNLLTPITIHSVWNSGYPSPHFSSAPRL